MQKRRLLIWVGLSVVAMSSICAVWLNAVPHAIFDDRAAPLAATVGTSPADTRAPVAVIEQTLYDFGDLDPADTCSHAFTIRNEGTAPLKLMRGRTTCKCTMSELPQRPVLPGDAAAVKVASKLEQEAKGVFSHAAIILTNDPQKPKIELRIRGRLRTYFGFDPPRAQFPAADWDTARVSYITMYSQVWDDFVVDEIKASVPAMELAVESAAEGRLESLRATSGKQLTLTLPPDLFRDSVAGWVDVSVHPAGDPERRRNARLAFVGRTLKQVEWTGKDLVGAELVELGWLRPGQSASTGLLLRVRDRMPALKVEEVAADVPFIRAHLEPMGDMGTIKGIYRARIEIPGDAPACNYLRPNPATIRFRTDHPILSELTLHVSFAVATNVSRFHR